MLLKQSSTNKALVFFMADSADHVTGKTGLSPTVGLSKNGGSFASPSGAVSEIGNGFYKVAGNATDDNTLGMLALYATASGADPASMAYCVVAFDPDTVAVGAVMPTTAGRTLDVSATGEAGIDWANVGSPTTSLALTGTTIATTQKVDVETIKTNPVVNGGTFTFPTNATGASTTGAVGSVTGSVGSVAGAVGSVTGSVGSVTGNVGGSVASVTAAITLPAAPTDWLTAAAVKADAVTKIQSGLSTYAGGPVASVTGSVGSVTAAITLPSIPTDWITSAGIATDAIDAAALKADAVTKIQTGLPSEATIAAAVRDVDNTSPAADSLGEAINNAGGGTAPTVAQIADGILGRRISGGANSVRTVGEALAFLRNKWSISGTTLTVFDVDDSTPLWTATVSTDAGAVPVVGNDPG